MKKKIIEIKYIIYKKYVYTVQKVKNQDQQES